MKNGSYTEGIQRETVAAYRKWHSYLTVVQYFDKQFFFQSFASYRQSHLGQLTKEDKSISQFVIF